MCYQKFAVFGDKQGGCHTQVKRFLMEHDARKDKNGDEHPGEPRKPQYG